MTLEAKLIALLLAVLGFVGSCWYAYHAGDRNGTNAVLVKTQAASLDALTKRLADNLLIAKKNQDNYDQEKMRHEKELSDVKSLAAANAGKRVRVTDSFCTALAGADKAAETGSHGQAITTAKFLPVQFTDTLRGFAVSADETVADLRSLIKSADDAKCFQ